MSLIRITSTCSRTGEMFATSQLKTYTHFANLLFSHEDGIPVTWKVPNENESAILTLTLTLMSLRCKFGILLMSIRWKSGATGESAYVVYSQFQLTFHCNIPNFVAKFQNLLRSSKVHFGIRKPVCKLSIWLASLSLGNNYSLCLQTGLRILKWTFGFRNEFPNFATTFGILQWKVS